ncbi:hypothetical protein Tco_1330988 [Tanacetum coccineum]
MKDDLFSYELEVLKDFYFPCVEQPCDDLENGDLEIYKPRQCYDDYERMFAEAVILIDNRLVKLIDITLEQWLDLKFGDHKKVDKEIMEGMLVETDNKEKDKKKAKTTKPSTGWKRQSQINAKVSQSQKIAKWRKYNLRD